MGFLEDRDLSAVPTIPDFYKGKTIFVTGGTGFMGKVLIEKLLYSCSELDRIYLLMRNKKGKEPEQRLADIYSSQCFNRLKEEKPDVFEKKVFFISGDVAEIGLGLSGEDRALLINKVNIIFHAAASVRFDDPLPVAVKLNLRSTKELIDLAAEMKNLVSLVHVSTSYANTNRDTIEEVLYPPLANWRDTLSICENMDELTLKVFTPKFLGEMPNTYVFTKQLAEHAMFEQKGKLPVVITRPSIVISSHSEPMPGWIENFNGPTGIMIASAKGIIRTVYSDPDLKPDHIPVDVAIKGIIAAAWIRGTKTFKETGKNVMQILYLTLTVYHGVEQPRIHRVCGAHVYAEFLASNNQLEPTDDIPIYNCCAGKLNGVTNGETMKIGHKLMEDIPVNNMIWNVGGTITTSKFVYRAKVYLFHLLPALLIDSILWLAGKKTMLVKIHRRIYIANMALHYYLTRQWTFTNTNFIGLRSAIKEKDVKDFYYEIENIDPNEFFRWSCIGGRRYLLKEKDEDIPKARIHFRRLRILDKLVQSIFYGYVLWKIVNAEFFVNFLGKLQELI